MTEEEWLVSEDPCELMTFPVAGFTLRKLRLFFCSCCQRVVQSTPAERRLFRGYYAGSFHQLERALTTVEQYAEGAVDSRALTEARASAEDSNYVPHSIDYGGETGFFNEIAAVVAIAVEHPNPDATLAACVRATCSQSSIKADLELQIIRSQESRWQAKIYRDIFGNPFRPVAFDPAWRTSTAIGVALQMYDSRDFGAMPILADALQDAGCENDDILSHCRGDGPHVRGCWVVDLLLGKE